MIPQAFINPPVWEASTLLLVVVAAVIMLAATMCLLSAMFTAPTVPPEADGPEPDWRALYGEEQKRFDQMRALFERQRYIDDLSPAAWRQEQSSIDTEFRLLTGPVEPTRRSEP
jgi:hypothetical protein